MSSLEVFKSFYTEESAVETARLLKENGIESLIEKKKWINDKIIVGEDADTTIALKINPIDFPKAHQILDSYISNNLSSIDSDYYLFSFSDNELMDILKKPDEWSNQDVIIARKILSDRGREISEYQVQAMKTDRLLELSKPEKERSVNIFAGYVLSVLLPLYGLIMGLLFATSKKVLPDGRKYHVYTESVRNHGVFMIVISTVLFLMVMIDIFKSHYLIPQFIY